MPPAPPIQLCANVPIPSTPLVAKAMTLAQTNLTPALYNHSRRAMLFGFIIADKLPALRSRDREAHAIAAILHDIGLAASAHFISGDRRFEVDGAECARAFLKTEGGEEWDERRCQVVWDAIALHMCDSIALHKEPEVVATLHGVNADFGTPNFDQPGQSLVTMEEYAEVLKEVPRLGMKEGVRDAFCRLCQTKPATTWDNLVGQFGAKYVDGFKMPETGSLEFVEADTLEEQTKV